ncbi:SixA phosphatase family protein [Lacinutrix salivirga]
MKNILFFILLTVFSCQNKTETQKDTNTSETVYYLVRHAEKETNDATNKNPELTEEGEARAKKLAHYFKTIDLEAIYSTNYIRTVETAVPTAKQKRLEIKTYTPNRVNFDSFKAETKGQKVLIVGHSNSTPQFVNSLIEKEVYTSLDESVYNALFIVTIKGDKITHQQTTLN